MFRKTHDNLPEFPEPHPLFQLLDAAISHSLPVWILLLGLIGLCVRVV